MATRAHGGVRVRETANYAKRISTHVAYALVLYTLMLIFAVSPQMESEGTSIFPYFLLVILVGLVIMPCRGLEHRWKALDAADGGDEGHFKRDIIMLWLGAVGLPALLATILWILP
jgi:hypothetical protein